MEKLSKKDIIDSFDKLKRQIQLQAAKQNPEAQGRAHGRVLRAIFANDGIIAKDLAAILDIRPSAMTDKLNKLEADGLIIRMRERRDLRIVRICLTDKGRMVIVRRDLAKISEENDFTDCLTKEESQLFCDMCERMYARLEEILAIEKEKSNLLLLAMKKESKKRAKELYEDFMFNTSGGGQADGIDK